MEIEERFQRIENALLNLAALQEGNQKALGTLIASISAYVDQANERTKHLEENLDALIRAITTEHKNGKTK